MDLLGRAVIIAVVLAVIVIGAFLYVQHLPPKQTLTETQAQSIVVSDIQQTYPGSIVNITQINPSAQYSGSWYITAVITTNATTPCPNYFVYTYNYPATGLVPGTQNTYTKGYMGSCTVNSTIIGAEPVAVAKSYIIHDPVIDSYISTYGYKNMYVTAQYYKQLALFLNNYTNVWLVSYTSQATQNSTHMVLSEENGTDIISYSDS